MITSEELADLCKSQDVEAIISHFDPYILSQAKCRLPLFPNGYELDDLIQVARISVWECAMKSREVKLVTYFYIAIKGAILNELKRANRKKRVVLSGADSLDRKMCCDTEDTFLDILPDTKLGVEPQVIRREQLGVIEDAKSSLSKKQLEYFNMWSKGYRLSQIAVKYNTSYYCVSGAVNAAKIKIRSNLEVMSSL